MENRSIYFVAYWNLS